MPSSARVHGAARDATREVAAPVNGRTETFDPDPRGGGGDNEGQARPTPSKGESKFLKLGSHLGQLVASVEAGQATDEEAPPESPVHRKGRWR